MVLSSLAQEERPEQTAKYEQRLFASVKEGNLQWTKYLLEEKKISPKIVNEEGQNLLHVALSNSSPKYEIVDLLLKNGVDPNLLDDYGQAPMNIARIYGAPQDILDLLGKYDAKEIEIKTDTGPEKPEAHPSAITDDRNAKSRQEPTDLLKDVKVVLSYEGLQGYEIMLHAIRHGDVKKVNEMLDAGADPNYFHDPSEISYSYLAQAIYYGQFQIASRLLEKGADPGIKDAKRRYSFHIKTSNEKQNEVAELVKIALFDQLWIHDSKEYSKIWDDCKAMSPDFDNLDKFSKAKAIFESMRIGNGEFDITQFFNLLNQALDSLHKEKNREGLTLDELNAELKKIQEEKNAAPKGRLFSYVEGEGRIELPREVLKAMLGDCDDMVAAYENALSLVGFRTDQMFIVSLSAKATKKEEEGEKNAKPGKKKAGEDNGAKGVKKENETKEFNHSVGVIQHDGAYYLADVVNGLFKKLDISKKEEMSEIRDKAIFEYLGSFYKNYDVIISKKFIFDIQNGLINQYCGFIPD